MSAMVGVTRVSPLGNHVLSVDFSDGLVGDVDCSFLLAGGLGVELRDPAFFRQVSVDPELRTVIWPNGVDPAPELLHRHLKASAAAVSSAA